MKITKNDDKIKYLKYTGNDQFSTLPNDNVKRFDSDDGIIYYIQIDNKRAVDTNNYEDIPNNQHIGAVAVDVTGADGPNRIRKDFFIFALYNDGTIRPFGA